MDPPVPSEVWLGDDGSEAIYPAGAPLHRPRVDGQQPWPRWARAPLSTAWCATAKS